MDIEVRYPTRSDVKRLRLHDILEVNEFVDSVLSTVYETIQKGHNEEHRRIVFSSFNPVVCTALNWKQPNFSVFFASYCGLSRSNSEGRMVAANRVEEDRRCTSIREAVKFAKSNNLLGVMLDATILVRFFFSLSPFHLSILGSKLLIDDGQNRFKFLVLFNRLKNMDY